MVKYVSSSIIDKPSANYNIAETDNLARKAIENIPQENSRQSKGRQASEYLVLVHTHIPVLKTPNHALSFVDNNQNYML